MVTCDYCNKQLEARHNFCSPNHRVYFHRKGKPSKVTDRNSKVTERNTVKEKPRIIRWHGKDVEL